MPNTIRLAFTTFLILVFANVAPAEVVTIEVTIKAVDATGRTVTATRRDKTLTLDVSRKAEVIINGEAGELAALGNGQAAKIDYETNLEIITKIEATGQALPAPELLVLSEINTANNDWGAWLSPDGLTIYWHSTGDDGKWIWTATRKTPDSLFEEKTRLVPGSMATVTGDGLEMILLQGNELLSTTRQSTESSFNRPRAIAELSAHRLLAPSISEDGLTLYVEQYANDAYDSCRISFSKRESRTSKWSEPRLLYGLEDHALKFPYVTSDGRMLIGANSKVDGADACNFMVFSRPTPDEDFKVVGFVDCPATLHGGLFPRYCPATKELFFSSAGEGNTGVDLVVVKNFSPGTMVRDDSLPVVQPSESPSLEGTWTAVAEESNGRRMTPAELKEAKKTLQIQNGKFVLSWSGKTIRGDVKAMADQNPKAVDLSGDLSGRTIVLKAIYEVKGDTMRLCYTTQVANVRDVDRPTGFETTADSGSVSVTYKRKR